ncbi:glycoside hydrolase family 5 protein [Pontiella sulfatireligans]|uniref:Endoglucanase H n=1 Tax=Pontiella sulfatireligans TaxID=2750658 RepID=A0A6C2UGF0_9BACT|nr:glycoside hydrolase family 5 protein [Pontiella sulfatireligans]VGO19208.1 Endoglucanase H [Pontiella sulfatireligans]
MGFLQSATSADCARDAFYWNSRIGRGINFGNTFESPKEKEGFRRLKLEHFDLIKSAGFDSVRIPVRWSDHAGTKPPYRIDPEFQDRVDRAIKEALSRDLTVIVNMHHYRELMDDPEKHEERFLSIWKQLAEHYRDYPLALYFEPLNEPVGKLNAARWNGLQNKAVQLIRKTNPERAVLIAPIGWNRIDELGNLEVPDANNLIVSVHYYEPHEFTHQGARWVDAPRPLGIRWTGSAEERRMVEEEMKAAVSWSKTHSIPVNIGEFGAYSKADMESRRQWTTFIREQAEANGISWNYWELYSVFGIYDSENNFWRKELLDALLPDNKIDESQKRSNSRTITEE